MEDLEYLINSHDKKEFDFLIELLLKKYFNFYVGSSDPEFGNTNNCLEGFNESIKH